MFPSSIPGRSESRLRVEHSGGSLSLALVLASLLTFGCHRQARVSVADGVQAVEHVERGEPAVITAGGVRWTVTRLDEIGVMIRRTCDVPEDCSWLETHGYELPVRMKLSDDRLLVEGGKQQLNVLRTDVDHVVLRESAPERGAIMAGTAVLVAALVGYGALRLTEGMEGDTATPELLSIFTGAGAGALTLLVTGPLTLPLGDEVETR